jgi:hypothetical protein
MIPNGNLSAMPRRGPKLPVAVAYFDETGTGGSAPVFGVAGWIAYTDQWEAFTRSWRRSLKNAGVDVFHMKDFAGRRRAFANWSDARCLSLIRALANIAQSKTFAGIARAVESGAYAALAASAEEALRLPSSPYVFCFQCCLEFLAEICGPLPPGSVDLVCEDTHGVKGAVLQHFEELKRRRSEWAPFNAPTFAPKALPPLQAADLLAYETQKYVREQLAETGRPLRNSLKALLERRKLSAKVLDKDALQRMVDDLRAGRLTPSKPPTMKWLAKSVSRRRPLPPGAGSGGREPES